MAAAKPNEVVQWIGKDLVIRGSVGAQSTFITGGVIGAGLAFHPRSIEYDPTGDRVFASDINTSAIMQIDLSTDDRSALSDASTATGDPFVSPMDLALDLANSRTLVSDMEVGAENQRLERRRQSKATADRDLQSLRLDAASERGGLVGNGAEFLKRISQNRAFAADQLIVSLAAVPVTRSVAT